MPPPVDPNNPTLSSLKIALDNGNNDIYPPNTLIPDTYTDNGTIKNIYWVVGHYGRAVKQDGSWKDGVYLFRSACPINYRFGTTNKWADSDARSWLGNTYYNNSSEFIKANAEEIRCSYSTDYNSNDKIWLMTSYMMMGRGEQLYGTEQWDAWKIRTGLTSPSNDPNVGRIMYSENGATVWMWLRDRTSSTANNTNLYHVNTNGQLIVGGPTTNYLSLCPACFIAKS